jgi:hypothetical protein
MTRFQRRLAYAVVALVLLWLAYLQSVQAYNQHNLVPHRSHESGGGRGPGGR